jgi:hypothetical protein
VVVTAGGRRIVSASGRYPPQDANNVPLQVVPLHVPRQLHPSAGLPLQFAQPGEHESMWQLPLWQDSVAKYWQHVCPHVPQLWASVDTSTQVPLHGVNPLEHIQLPLLQTSPALHAWPQPPQLCGSVASVTHAPLHAVSPEAHCVEHWPCEQTSPAPHA